MTPAVPPLAPDLDTPVRALADLPVDAASDATPPETPILYANAPAGPGHGSGLVLVVDDEPVVRKLTGALLKSFGYTPVYAADGPEAVRVYADHRAALKAVFLDLTMPGLDGLQVFRAIREQGGTTPVVLMSGSSEYEVREKFGRLGFQGFLSKPFSRADVSERLADLTG